MPIPAVIDINEGEYRAGMPLYRYEQLVAHIAALSKECGYPLAVSTELKRGEFDAETLIAMIDIHRKYGVPVLMHSTDQERLIEVGGIVAQAYVAILNR